jgi:hypothetical protein
MSTLHSSSPSPSHPPSPSPFTLSLTLSLTPIPADPLPSVTNMGQSKRKRRKRSHGRRSHRPRRSGHFVRKRSRGSSVTLLKYVTFLSRTLMGQKGRTGAHLNPAQKTRRMILSLSWSDRKSGRQQKKRNYWQHKRARNLRGVHPLRECVSARRRCVLRVCHMLSSVVAHAHMLMHTHTSSCTTHAHAHKLMLHIRSHPPSMRHLPSTRHRPSTRYLPAMRHRPSTRHRPKMTFMLKYTCAHAHTHKLMQHTLMQHACSCSCTHAPVPV